MSFGEILNRIIDFLIEFWPIRCVREWERGVLLRAGKIVGPRDFTTGVFGTGYHLVAPFLHELKVEEAARDVQITPWLDFVTKDERTISLRLAIHYEIADMAKLYRGISDYESSVLTAVCSEVVEVGLLLPYKDIDSHLCNTALPRCRKMLNPWGVRLRHLAIASVTTAQALRLIGEPPVSLGQLTE